MRNAKNIKYRTRRLNLFSKKYEYTLNQYIKIKKIEWQSIEYYHLMVVD